MQPLNDFVYILNRYTVREIDVITNPDRKKTKEDSRYWEFYTGLQKGRWKDEDETAVYFGYSSKNDKGFRRMKEGLKERLMNSVLFIDLGAQGLMKHHQKAQELYKLWAISECLSRRGAFDAYYETATRALDIALDIENVSAIVEIVCRLRTYLAVRPNFNKEYKRLNQLYDKYWCTMKLEMDAQNDLLFIISNLVDKKGYKKEFAPIAETCYKKHSNHLATTDTVMFHVYSRLLQVYAHILVHNWKEGLQAAEAALAFLATKGERSAEHIVTFGTQKASCLLMLQRYEEAKETLNSLLEYAPEGKPTWFKNREVAAVNALYAQDYSEAWRLVNQALNHGRFNLVSELDQETWRLYYGYLQLMMKSGTANFVSDRNCCAEKFRLTRWLNDMPLYSLDKRGGNIPLLILQLHFLIAEYKDNPVLYDSICNRVEALRKYVSRNLDRGSEHYRTDCFLGLVQLLPKYLNAPEMLPGAAQPILQKMSSVKIDLLDSSFETEVVPYERQWEWIQAQLMPRPLTMTQSTLVRAQLR